MLRMGDTGDWVGTFEGHKGAVWGVALNRTATLAASGAADFSAKIWDAVSGEEKSNFQHNHIVKSVAFDEDSTHLLTGNNEKLMRVFDLNQPSTNPAVEMYSGHSGAIKRALFCRNDKCIVSCAEDKAVKIWDRSTGQPVQQIDFNTNPSSIEISRDGSILTVTNGSNVSFFEMDSLKKIKEITVPTKLAAASLHPDKLGETLELLCLTRWWTHSSSHFSVCLRR
jgi:serine-threonine kinase receptor-associated protein